MATTQTLFTPRARMFAFEGMGSIDQKGVIVPRSEVTFVVSDGDVTVAAAGEDQRIFVSAILPPNFSYVLVDCFVRLKNANAADWNVVGEIGYGDSDGTDRTFLASQEIVSHGTVDVTATTISRIWCPCGSLLKVLLLQLRGKPAPRVSIFLANGTIDGAAGLLNVYLRFLQYDVNQAHHVQVNTAILVR